MRCLQDRTQLHHRRKLTLKLWLHIILKQGMDSSWCTRCQNILGLPMGRSTLQLMTVKKYMGNICYVSRWRRVKLTKLCQQLQTWGQISIIAILLGALSAKHRKECFHIWITLLGRQMQDLSLRMGSWTDQFLKMGSMQCYNRRWLQKLGGDRVKIHGAWGLFQSQTQISSIIKTKFYGKWRRIIQSGHMP